MVLCGPMPEMVVDTFFQRDLPAVIFYFAVPYQSNGNKKSGLYRGMIIMPLNWKEVLQLDQYEVLDNQSFKPVDWIGKKNGNATYPIVFRIVYTPNKKVSVFECNWMETGSPGTDIRWHQWFLQKPEQTPAKSF